MTTYYMTATEIAEHLGLSYHTVRRYQSDGLLPEPDAVIGRGRQARHGWLKETIDEWQANRPGRWKKRGDLLA